MENIKLIDERDILGKVFRVYGNAESPLFMAKDVAEWIEHSNPRMMLKNIDEDEKVVRNAYTLGGMQETWFLTEDGLYEVLMQSRKPIAKEFKRQVKAILKEIRLTGSHILDNKQAEVNAVEKVITKVQDLDVLNLITSLAEQQKLLMEENKHMHEVMVLNEPKIKFASNVEVAEGTFSVGELAKAMANQGLSIGRNRLMDWMRESGYIGKQRGVEYNKPKQNMIERGYMQFSIYVTQDKEGIKHIKNTPLITGKGLVYFLNKYIESL